MYKENPSISQISQISQSPAYCYMKYLGNLPYYSDYPRLKFLKTEDWRFSSQLFHRYCNLNSPLNKCYISSGPSPRLLEKSHFPRDEKLDFLYLRGHHRLLDRELARNYESHGFLREGERFSTETQEDFEDFEFVERRSPRLALLRERESQGFPESYREIDREVRERKRFTREIISRSRR